MKSLEKAQDFGATDAENDHSLLLKTFEDHEAFISLKEMERFLIVGKKGSGKTAIFKKMLSSNDSENFIFGHTFSDYPWDHHNKQARAGIPDFDRFTHSWKYLILLTLSKILLNYDQSLPWNDESMNAMEKLEAFVIDTYGSRDLDVTQIFTPSKQLKLKPNFVFNTGLLRAGVSPESVPMTDLPLVVQEVNQNLIKYTLSSLNPEHRYYLCFDELDVGFDPHSSDYISRLIGLLLACRDINLAAREAGKQFVAAIFLRDDIFDMLQFEDKNKLRENSLSLIEWDTPRTDKSLKSLMEKRFQEVLGDNSVDSISWSDVFDETQEMPGHQSKYQHILDRTYLRPRDIIKFTNSILGNYKKRMAIVTETSGNLVKFSNVDIHDSRTEYSNYLQSELEDEIPKHMPEYKGYLDLLRAIGGWQFERALFENLTSTRTDLTGKEHPGVILEKLYDWSVVGFYRAGGRGYGGSEYVFRYKERQTRFDPTSLRFRVHPGLVEVLGLKKVNVQGDGSETLTEELPFGKSS